MSDSLPEFADDDLEVLLDALEAWENKDVAGDITSTMLDVMIESRVGPPPPEVAHQLAEQRRQREDAKRLRKERSILLRAKILTLRDRRRAEHMTSEALSQPIQF